MALLNAKLYVKRNGEAAVPCNLYSTTEEVGGEYVTVTASNTKAYAKLGGTSDTFCTQGRVKKGTNTYAILSQAKPPYNKIEYRTPGTYTVTFPAGVTRARGTVAGAGGGGGGAVSVLGTKGGNGGTGALITKNIIVTPLSTLLITVGTGGAGGAAGVTTGSEGNKRAQGETGGTGGTSSIGNLVSAQGGTGGTGAFYIANHVNEDGSNGTSYGNGGVGGTGGVCSFSSSSNRNGSTGANGWVIIEYGGDI